MKKDSSEQLRHALITVLQSREMTVAGWCRDAGIPESTLRNFLRGRSETLTHATLAALAKAIDESVPALLSETPLSFSNNVGVIGEIKKELSKDYGYLSPPLVVSIPQDLRFARFERWAAIVRDESANKHFPIGTIVIYVEFNRERNLIPLDGDLVICREYISADDRKSGACEVTIKRHNRDKNGVEWLTSISNEANFNETILLPKPLSGNMLSGMGGPEEVLYWVNQRLIKLEGLVIASYRMEGGPNRHDGITHFDADKA